MKIVHGFDHYIVPPKPVFDVNIRGNGPIIGLSTRLHGTVKEHEPTWYEQQVMRGPNFVGIDFEDASVEKWVAHIYGVANHPGFVSTYKRDLLVDGLCLYGCFPVQDEGNNIWKCSVDHFEDIMSHRQHYRYKDFPASVARVEFTTFENFKTVISSPEVQHVIVDSLAHQLLADSFEEFQDEAKIATTEEGMLGLILRFGDRLVFADTFLPTNRHWVNQNPGSTSARPQFIVVDPAIVKPFA